MFRSFLIFVALLLPLQFAASAASAYCQHETSEPQSKHFGHHVHAHKGEVQKPSGSKLMADPDCASCHAGASAALPTRLHACDPESASMSAEAMPLPPFSSALARAPDRPQWLRLV